MSSAAVTGSRKAMSGSGSPYRNLDSGGSSGYQDYESVCDPFDIVSTKSASVDRLKRWRQAALVLNASRRFRYTLDLKKEEEKKRIIAMIRTHAQAIRAAYIFQAAGEKPDSSIPSTSMTTDPELPTSLISIVPLRSPDRLEATRSNSRSTVQSVSAGGCASRSTVQSVWVSDQSTTSDWIVIREERIPPNNLSRPESTHISMEMIQMEYSNYTLNTQHPVSFPYHEGILYLLYAVAIGVMYPALAQLIQLKFQNNKPSPFETHSFFTYTSAVAYVIAIMTSTILFYMRAYMKKMSMERFLPASYYVYMILKTLFYLSGILAPLSLVLVLLIPHSLSWTGYPILFLVFVIIVACNFSDTAKLLHRKCKSKLSIWRAGLAQRESGAPPRASSV